VLPAIGGVELYLPLVAVAAGIGFATFVRLARRVGWPAADAARFELILVGGALVGAYVYSGVERGVFASAVSGDTAGLFRIGLRYPGGLLGAVLAVPLATCFRPATVSWLTIADLAAPATGFAMAAVRIGCLLQGCCFGRETDLPWGLQFPVDSPAWFAHFAEGRVGTGSGESLPVHPLQIYFALLALAAGLVSLHLVRRRARPGRALAAFLALHETGRALLEPLRVPYLVHLQIISAVLGALGAVGWFALREGRRLRQAGFSEQQAEAQTEALAAVVTETLATKQDLRELRRRAGEARVNRPGRAAGQSSSSRG
jgi:phosphatidylglycerol:prolipoprotein diacylglycerol transferase